MKNLKDKVVMDVVDNVWLQDVIDFGGSDTHIDSDIVGLLWRQVEDRLSFNHGRKDIMGWPEEVR